MHAYMKTLLPLVDDILRRRHTHQLIRQIMNSYGNCFVQLLV